MTREYTDAKPIWSPLSAGEEPRLSGIPQVCLEAPSRALDALRVLVALCVLIVLRALRVPHALRASHTSHVWHVSHVRHARRAWYALHVTRIIIRSCPALAQLKAIYAEAEERVAEMDAYVAKCEAALSPLLASRGVPSAELAHAIAVAKVSPSTVTLHVTLRRSARRLLRWPLQVPYAYKLTVSLVAVTLLQVKAVETSIDLCNRLKQEVGSYALMGDSGFVHLDFLNCCKFAEGDSRILMQKMARDRFRRAIKDQKAGVAPPASHADEIKLCLQLGAALAAAKGDKRQEVRAFAWFVWGGGGGLWCELVHYSCARSVRLLSRRGIGVRGTATVDTGLADRALPRSHASLPPLPTLPTLPPRSLRRRPFGTSSGRPSTPWPRRL